METETKFAQTIVVEHMEPYLFEWCLAEYQQMQRYLHNYDVRLLITNSQSFLNFHSDKTAETEENKAHIEILEKSFAEDKPGKCVIVPPSVVEIASSAPEDRGMLSEPVCMLDLRAEKELSPSETWGTLIFGGILGDHPPRDRPQPVRKHFSNLRHLGEIQLATDTAVLISRLILQNKLPLSRIPVIKEPTIRGLNANGEKTSVQMEGFSYVSRALDIETGKVDESCDSKTKREIHISEKVRELLLRDDLDPSSIM